MTVIEFPSLRDKLISHIKARTGGRLTNLLVKLSRDEVVLHGEANSFYVKQLAQQGVRELLPEVRLENAIVVA